MTFYPQTNPDGSPNKAALFINALLIDGLYRQDPTPWNQYAAISGSRLVAFESNPLTWTPDYGILLLGDSALVAFGGTTNSAQWVGHMASAFFPLIDSQTQNVVVGQFYLGLNVVEQAVTAAIRTALRGTVMVTGHSYGAGAGKIFCDHLASLAEGPGVLQLTTFGEPKATGSVVVPPRTYTHNRIVAGAFFPRNVNDAEGLDPVSFAPPGILQLFKFPFLATAPLSLLGVKWAHFGNAWQLTPKSFATRIPELIRTNAYDSFLVSFDPVGWLTLTSNLQYASIHPMEQTYLPRLLSLYQGA